jgi:hypothetical protein
MTNMSFMKKVLTTISSLFIIFGCVKSTPENSYTGTLSITSLYQLNSAIALGDEVKTLSGNLTVFTGGTYEISASDVSQVTSKITNIDGNVLINTPDGSIDLSALTNVGGSYDISGSDVDDDSLATVGGAITLNYPGGYSMPNLTTAAEVIIVPNSAPISNSGQAARGGTSYTLNNLIISFPRLSSTIRTSGSEPGVLLLPRFPGGGNNYTRMIFGPNVLVRKVIAPSIEDIEIQYDKPVPSPIIIDAPRAILKMNLPSLNNNITITASQIDLPNLVSCSAGINILPLPPSISKSLSNDTISFNAPALTSVEGDFNVSCPGEVKLDKLTNIAGNFNVSAPKIGANSILSITGKLIARSNNLSMPNLATVGGNVSVKKYIVNNINVETSVDFTSLSNVGGELEIEADNIEQNTGQPHNSGGSTHNSGGN